MAKTALITGFTGQDGSYLTELLLAKGYRVIAAIRPAVPRQPRTDFGASQHLVSRVTTVCFPETSEVDWHRTLAEYQPDEVYHLAAQSSVWSSWERPVAASHANFDFTAVLLEALRKSSASSKLFFACSSEVFGLANVSPQDEHTAIAPVTPYGVTKAAAHWLLQCYRQRYGLFVCSGFLFNHESPRRPTTFVSRKITHTAAKIKLGLADRLELGDLSARRDWGFAGDFVEAMWRSLQLATPEDFVIGTSRQASTEDFVELAFNSLGLDWREFVTINRDFIRPNDPRNIVANISKAKRLLDWSPNTTLPDLVQLMVQSDLQLLQRQSSDLRRAA